MTRANFWNGARNVARQRGCHVGAGASYVALMAALPQGAPSSLRTAGIAAALVFGVGATLLVASPWTDRRRIVLDDRQGPPDVLCSIVGIGASLLALGLCVARMWWEPPKSGPKTLPGDLVAQVGILWAEIGLVLLLALLVFVQRPWQQSDVLGRGMATPLFALLACMVSGIFGAALTLTFANLVGSPKAALGVLPAVTTQPTLYVPTSVYAYGFGFLVTAGAVILLVAAALVARAIGGRRRADSTVQPVYADAVAGGPLADPARTKQARLRVGKLWAQAHLSDFAAVGLAVMAIPTAAGVAAYQLVGSIQAGHHLPRGMLVASSVGSTIALAVTAYFLAQLRAAFRDARVRRRIGLIWDVGTFWPRSCHPFAPPCYAERAIPEVVSRIRHVVGDVQTSTDPVTLAPRVADADPAAGLREQHSPLLLCGYSQGSPIAVAVSAQLPASAIGRVALLTLAAPVRRLYGRTFPAYFGPGCLSVLLDRLTTGEAAATRWRNAVRRSDYVGGFVICAISPGDGTAGPVDREILDPPILWADNDPTQPPYHLHSDWFQDPQTRPFADELMTGLVEREELARA